MLKRLNYLCAVQRWHQKKSVEFSRATVIYGENGRGKTALSAVLRSLASGDAAPILERHTIGVTEAPSAQLLVDLGNSNLACTFDGTAWSQRVPQIEVFDTTFVSQNVYSGDTIDPEHHQCLHKFVLGAQNVALAQEVDRLDDEIRDLSREINQLEKTITTMLKDKLPIAKFLTLVPDTMIDERIADLEDKVHVGHESSQIAGSSPFVSLAVPGAAFAEALNVLAESLETFAEEAEARVRHHVISHLGAKGRQWLEEGMNCLFGRGECPFCGQDTASSSLVADYRVVFSDLYRQHGARLATTRRKIFDDLGESILVGIEGEIASNKARSDFWKGHGISAPETGHLSDLRKLWLKAVSAMDVLFAEKDKDVLKAVNPTDDQRTDFADFQLMLEHLVEYNSQVSEINAKVFALKRQAGEVTLQAAEKQLALLKLEKERYEPTTDALCKSLIVFRAEKKEAENAKQAAKKELDAATEQLFDTYQATLNKHLANCGCGYSITGIKTSYAGGKPRTEYQLLLNGQPVELAQPKAKPHDPCFRNTLSDGDRTTLAFALFLARLELDHTLGDRIVVLDDPMTSLDVHRRAYTCEQIGNIAGKARQVIVLTHDVTFAADVWDRLLKPKKALSLRASGADTVADDWDIAVDTQTLYFCRCKLLRDCTAGVNCPDLIAVATAIRPVIEANLRTRFPDTFDADMWLGGFIEKIRAAKDTERLAGLKPKLKELTAINDYSKKFHHDGTGSFSVSQPTLSELQSYSRRTLDFLAGT
ncbi:MAG: AAA family ATPase [Anaerolineae bacterium]